MKLKLTLVTVAGEQRDILVTADATSTIADIARRMTATANQQEQHAPEGIHAGSALTLRVEFPGARQGRVLNPGALVHEATIRSGCKVEVVRVGERRPGDERDDAAAAIVSVVSGPDAGNQFPVPHGVSLVGRDPSAAVYLARDREVSRRHASITVGETVSVADLNSANGVQLDGALVQRAIVTSSTRIRIGRAELRVMPMSTSTGLPSTASGDGAFSRSPRIEPAYRGETFTLPEIPAPPPPARLSFLMLVSPLLLGAAIFFVTGNPGSLLFVAMSPLLMIGTWLDSRTRSRRRSRVARAGFDEGMRVARERLTTEREHELRARADESPDIAEVVAAVRDRTPLLWTRKPEHATFLEVRFGLGRQRSRCTVQLPSKNGGELDDWMRAEALAAEYADIGPVPVVESFERAGSVGVAGSCPLAQDAARALVLQLAGLHSPADLVICGFAAGDTTAVWAWLKWLPHVDGPHSPLRTPGLVADYAAGNALLADLEGLVALRTSQDRGRGGRIRSRLDETEPLDAGRTAAVERLPTLPAVLVIATAEAPAERARLVALADEGPDYGVFVLWIAPSVEALPVVCRSYLEIDPATACARVGLVRSGQMIPLSDIELVDALTAETAARALAPLRDAGARVLDETDLPRTVNFSDVYEGDVLCEPSAIIQRWVKNDSLTRAWIRGTPRDAGGIRAVVGHGPAEPFALDLRAHGPHALVGGTTGAGKSEFLQSWITGIATEYSPDRVTFLLVDYKGGAAFADCVDLPHTVGLVTDLTPHLVARALSSLRAELKHRETVLQTKGAKDLQALESRSDPDAPPVLIIVIDEFAALSAEVPDFVDGVIDIAQRGRSLGLHLVLATQRPSGVIKDSLRANTNLRVALRMADETDSTDVLGIPDAAWFDPGTPGRAAAKLGPGRVCHFQSAYLGGGTRAAAAEPEIHLHDLPFGPGQPWAVPDPGIRGTPGPPDIERLTGMIARAADRRGIDVPRRPWLDPLPAVIDLDALGAGSGHRLPIGTIDEPEAQRQRTLHLDLDTAGNVAVLGTGGSGKSTLLRTIAATATQKAGDHPVVIHVIDLAGGALAMLEGLPTVTSVIHGTDVERVTRLLNRIAIAVDERSADLAAARASTLAEFHALTGRSLTRVIVLVDGFGAFRSEYEFRNAGALFDRFLGIASTGRPLGIHLVLTADRAGAFPTALAATIGERVVLRLAGETEYAAAGVPGETLKEAPPGRALVNGHELQIAVAGGSPDLADQARWFDSLAGALRSSGIEEAKPIERLASHIPAASLPATIDGRPTIGVADETLDPIGVPLDGLFVVTGPFGSGRTTAMTTVIRATRATLPRLVPNLLVARRSSLECATDWARRATDADEAEALAARLTTELEQLPANATERPLIVIENVGDFEGLPAEAEIARLVKAARRAGVPVLAEADTVTAPSAWQLYAELKTARAGIVLQPEDTDGLALFRTAFPRMTRSEFPVGRGILVDSGALTRVHVAMHDT